MKSAPQKKGELSIKVNKEVVKHLSIGLYRNFALAIKELISNAYDAGATEVKIRLDLKKGKIIVRDNGRGMNYNEFKKEYLTIGFFKMPSKKPDELGRMRIGTFGIGFLAPLPYCKVMRVITKKRGEKTSIEATVQAENFFREGTWDIRREKVKYEIYDSDLALGEGETIISLEGIEPQIAEELRRDPKSGKSKIDQFGGFEKFRWTLGQYAAIQYPPERQDLRKLFDFPNRVPMKLWLDGEEIFRNIPHGVSILEKGEKHFGNIHVKYTIMTPFEPIKPEEARGLQVRMRDVAIGFPREFDVTKLGRVLGKLNMLCGEVHILSGLDNALMVNRDNFNYTKEVAEMYRFFQRLLRKWNDQLYDLHDEDKKVFDALGNLKNDDRIVSSLEKASILHFSKERMRLPDAPITKTKKTKLDAKAQKLVDVLKQKKDTGFKVISKKGRVSAKKAPIKVLPKERSVIVYEDHPEFKETIELEGKKFQVVYDKWDPKSTPYSICKLPKDGSVVFNTSHPLFDSKLSDEVIKKLSLGIVIILKRQRGAERIIRKLNDLLEYTFLG